VNTTGNTVSERYSYGYDALNRITSATDNTGHYNLTGILYDKNGNIGSLERKGHTAVDGTGQVTSFTGSMDNLDYGYFNGGASNRLYKVRDDGSDGYGFKDGTGDTQDYWYDGNGNMTSDANKGISSIEYNHLNVPTKITVTGSNAGTIDFIYDADGVKLRKIKTEGGVPTTTDYAGGYVYENGNLQFFSTNEGYVQPDGQGGYGYVYQYVDNIGNVRLSYTDANGDGSIDSSTEIIEENNYYPFGLKHKGYNGNVSPDGNSLAQKWKFEGQELNEDLGLDVYEWKYRIHDPAIGRFWQVDPLTEDYEWMTTYQFSSNQPIHAPELEGLESGYDLTTKLYMDGEITKEQYFKNQETRAVGAAIGLGVAADAAVTKGAVTKNLLKQTGVQTMFNTLEQGLSGENIDVGAALTESAGNADLADAVLDVTVSKLVPGGKMTEKAIETLVSSTVDMTSDGGIEVGGVNKSMKDVAVDFSFSVATDKVKGVIPNMKISGNKGVQKGLGRGVEFVTSQVQSAVQSPSTRRQSSSRQDPRLMQAQAQDNTRVKQKRLIINQ